MPPRRGTPHLLAVARGDEPADLLLTGGSIFVPGTKEWLREDLAIADGMIAGWVRGRRAKLWTCRVQR